jgi:hypothetical protein
MLTTGLQLWGHSSDDPALLWCWRRPQRVGIQRILPFSLCLMQFLSSTPFFLPSFWPTAAELAQQFSFWVRPGV